MTDEVRLRVLIGEYYQNTFHQTDRGLAEYLMAHGVVVREKGEWVDRRIFCFDGCIDCWECSVCGCRKVGREYFCPNCGADMRKGENG